MQPATDPEYTCPRCGGAVHRDEDGSTWCQIDGVVAAVPPFTQPSVYDVLQHLTDVPMPAWMPWPMPAHWALAGVGRAGERPVQAVVTAFNGPDPLDGTADLLLVSEEAGVGMGAGYAGTPGLQVAREIAGTPPATKVTVDGHATPLWWLGERLDRDVFVGEASGRWLWLIAFPATAGALVRGDLVVVDAHDLMGQLDVVPVTALSTRLTRD
ncbi:MAG: DUF6758 family protein [Nocardioidaceae bacterium]